MQNQIHIDAFEGPLDLLLHLIAKNKIDICDVFISEITTQYLETIQQWENFNMELASEFVLMAARLLEIKSKTLLPQRNDENEISAEELKVNLVQQLIEYQLFKNIGNYLGDKLNLGGIIHKDPDYFENSEKGNALVCCIEDLEKIFKTLSLNYLEDNTLKPYNKQIIRDNYTVQEQIEYIEKTLKSSKNHQVLFENLFFDNIESIELIVTFQAILELHKHGKIHLAQSENFSKIIIESV